MSLFQTCRRLHREYSFSCSVIQPPLLSYLSDGRIARFQVHSGNAEYPSVELSVNDDRIFELEGRLSATWLKLRDLATMGALITSILDMETILSVVMEMSIRTVEGEVGLIQLAEAGELVPKITWGVDASLVRNIKYENDTDIATFCFTRQVSAVMNNFDKSFEHGPTVNSVLALPIKSRARCHGAIVIINKTSGEDFTEEDRESLEIVINYAAVAIENSLLVEESLQKQKLEQELGIARQVQETILPGREIKIKGVDFGALYFPARFVGGDFYDIITPDDDNFLMVIGDVSNKGIPAAMVMAATTAIIRTKLTESPDISPSQLMYILNNVLSDGIIRSHDMFVTLFIARFSLCDKKVTYCNGGHLPPLYWDASRRQVSELRMGGTFVGQFPGTAYIEGELELHHGDRFFAFTDGLTEATDIKGRMFGIEKVKQVFMTEKELPAARFCERVKNWVDRFTEGSSADSHDDFTILKLRILPEGA